MCAAYFIEHQAEISPLAAVLTVAIPVSAFLAADLRALLLSGPALRLAPCGAGSGNGGCLVAAIVAARAGVNMPSCLVIVMLAPAVSVIGYEALGYRHQAAALAD